MNEIDFLSMNWLAMKINNDSFERFLHKVTGIVIDLGCGTSPYKEDLVKFTKAYIGVDWGKSSNNQFNVNVFADLTKPLPFKNDYADTIISCQVMEHLPEPGFFLSECYRILKSGGRLFITTPFMWHIHEAPYDYFRFTRYGLEYLLKKCGFVDIEIQENTGFWQMWVLKFNYHTRRFALGFFKYLWIPIWWIGQVISPLLDKYDKHPQETGSYTVMSRKPTCR
jgi:SAM-dependent methyltransferase